jgi:hypothetical protein
MNLLEDTIITDFLNVNLEQDILKSAYSRINDLHDPLRGPVFGLLMRELLRIVMERLAPDKLVEGASWCNGDPWTYVDPKDGKTKLTRTSRYRFAITGTISDQKLKEYPQLDCSSQINDLRNLVNKLSKFAHISPGTHGLSVSQSNDFLHEVEAIVSEYVKELDATKKHVGSIILGLVDSKLNAFLMEEIPNELDQLSTRTRLESVTLEELENFDTSAKFPVLSGSASAEVELNYGSRRDGFSHETSFPLQFFAQVNPDTFEISIESLNVDTSSFEE